VFVVFQIIGYGLVPPAMYPVEEFGKKIELIPPVEPVKFEDQTEPPFVVFKIITLDAFPPAANPVKASTKYTEFNGKVVLYD